MSRPTRGHHPRGVSGPARWRSASAVSLAGHPVHPGGQRGGGSLGVRRGNRDALAAIGITWMGRVDLQRTVHFLQLSVLGDWASVEDADFCAVGAGLVFLGGLLRFDLARGVRCGTPGPTEAGWSFHPLLFTFF